MSFRTLKKKPYQNVFFINLFFEMFSEGSFYKTFFYFKFSLQEQKLF